MVAPISNSFALSTLTNRLYDPAVPVSGPASDVRIEPAATAAEVDRFVRFPRTIYRDDPHWVPPLLSARKDKLDLGRNPFWRTAERALFVAYRSGQPVGTIAAIWDPARNKAHGTTDGQFGFFECIDDVAVAQRLLDTAAEWLRAHGATAMAGPYNPNEGDEFGVLVSGFDTRPAIVEAHTPRYYARLLEACGMTKRSDAFAWLVKAPPGARNAADLLPERFAKVALAIREGAGVTSRPLDLSRWDAEVETAWRLFNESLATVKDFVPIALADFRALAGSFRRFVVPEMIRFVEVDGRAVAYALAVPDINEALQAAGGKFGPIGMLKFWLRSRRLTRASFKILVVHPKYRHRGLEAVLILDVAQAMLDRGFTEADLSMTGEANTKINGYLEAMGLSVYRTVRIFAKDLAVTSVT